MTNYKEYEKKVQAKGYIGLDGYIDYNKITSGQKMKLKKLIDMNYLEDAKDMIEAILLDLKEV